MERPSRNIFEKLTDPLVYAVVVAVSGLLRLLGPRVGYALVAGVGFLGFRLFRIRRRVIHRNLDVAFGGRLDRADKDRIGLASFRHGLANVIDVLFGVARVHQGNWRDYISIDPVASEVLARAHPRGLAVLSAHLGSFEMGHSFLSLAGTPASPMVRSLDNPYLDRALTRARTAYGEPMVIRKVGGLKNILGELRAGRAVSIIADQNCPTEESYHDFFGVPASTYYHYARILARANCEVLFAVCLRDGFRFRFTGHSRVIDIPTEGSVEERADAIIRAYLDAIEELVRKYPEQYWWMHRRWKKQPEGEPSVYDRVGDTMEA